MIGAMYASMVMPCYASANNNTTSAVDDYQIVTTTANDDYNSSDVVILTEEQLIADGERIQDILNTAQMVYIPTTMSEEEIESYCGVSPRVNTVFGDPETKDATAITYDDGSYHFTHFFTVVDGSSVLSEAMTPAPAEDEDEVLANRIESVLRAKESKGPVPVTRAVPGGAVDYGHMRTDVTDSAGRNFGALEYTVWFYQMGKNASGRVFDSVCDAYFSPNSKAQCKAMSVTLGSNLSDHQIWGATSDIVSTSKDRTYNLSLSGSLTGLTITASTSWSYNANSQDVSKDFSNAKYKTWKFTPVSSVKGDSWNEVPGIRTGVTGSNKTNLTSVTLNATFKTIYNTILQPKANNSHSFRWS